MLPHKSPSRSLCPKARPDTVGAKHVTGTIQENARQDEGNAYLRLGEVLIRLGWEGGARAAYEEDIRLAEFFGHDGMAEDLRQALIELGDCDII